MIGDREKPRRLTLPPEEALPRIDAITVNARATWFALLGLLAFVGVTLLGVEDIDFFDASRRTDLPLVGVSVPTLTFFWVAPALTAAIYAYFHFYLMKLWDALAEAPAQVKGRRLGDLVHPWLVTDAALWFRRHEGATADRPLRIVSGFTAGALSWGFGWAVLGYAWWRSHTAHLEWMSLWLLALFVFSLWVGVSSLHAAWRRVGHGETRVRHQGKWPRRAVLAAAVPLVVVSWLRTEGGLESAVARVGDWAIKREFVTEEQFVAAFAVQGQGQKRERLAERWREVVAEPKQFAARFYNDGEDDNQRAHLRRRMLETGLLSTPWLSDRLEALPSVIAQYLSLAPIDLFEARIVEKPESWLEFETAEADFRAEWCRRRERPVSACIEPPETEEGEPDTDMLAARRAARDEWCSDGKIAEDRCEAFFAREEEALLADWKQHRSEYRSTLARPSLQGRDLRGANLAGAFLTGINLQQARMEGAILYSVRMEGANLAGARLAGANFRGARLEGAILEAARMEGAELGYAQLEGATLSKAWMMGADLYKARLDGAELRKARLEGAKLEAAQMEGADLAWVRLEGANLRNARMNRAVLYGAWMQKANLVGTRLDHAILSGAQMEGAFLRRAQMEGANLTQAKLERADLREVNLNYADLRGATFEDADLKDATNAGANARSVDLTRAMSMTQESVNALFGDRTTRLPIGYRRTDLMEREPDGSSFGPDPDYEAWLAAGAPPGKPLP